MSKFFAIVLLGFALVAERLHSRTCATWLSMLAASSLLFGCAAMPNTWTKENQRLEIAYQAVHVVDLGQTLDIKNHPGLKEDNWFLGEHPSDEKIALWYVGTAYGHAFVTSALERENAPRWLCRTWQAVTIGNALSNIHGNYKLGLRMGF